MQKTAEQYYTAIEKCKEVFLLKARDYGTSWTVLRLSSVTDQIFIKAQRIRNLEEGKENKVGESIENEFVGIVNYGVMALILFSDVEVSEQIEIAALEKLYDSEVKFAFDTMMKKNHDYGEAWRDMRISSFTDLILMKLLRLKQIEDNRGETLISEGVDANYVDIINYAVFALIKFEEQRLKNSN